MSAWADTLPATPIAMGHNDTRAEGVLRTEMDTGPAKTRVRFTAVPRYLTYQFYLTTTQKTACDTFYYTTVGMTGSFTFTDPMTAASLTCTFLAPPTYAVHGLGYIATVQFEVAP